MSFTYKDRPAIKASKRYRALAEAIESHDQLDRILNGIPEQFRRSVLEKLSPYLRFAVEFADADK